MNGSVLDNSNDENSNVDIGWREKWSLQTKRDLAHNRSLHGLHFMFFINNTQIKKESYFFIFIDIYTRGNVGPSF